MAVQVLASPPQHCARCAGKMYPGYEGEFTCLWCGEVVYPPTPTLHGDEDIEVWRRRLRGKPGRPRRNPLPDACA